MSNPILAVSAGASENTAPCADAIQPTNPPAPVFIARKSSVLFSSGNQVAGQNIIRRWPPRPTYCGFHQTPCFPTLTRVQVIMDTPNVLFQHEDTTDVVFYIIVTLHIQPIEKKKKVFIHEVQFHLMPSLFNYSQHIWQTALRIWKQLLRPGQPMRTEELWTESYICHQKRGSNVGRVPLCDSLAHKMAVHLLGSHSIAFSGVITPLHPPPPTNQRQTFSFIPVPIALPVHIVDCKHFNWMASVWCCDETMGKWREMRTLERASCFPQMPPAYSISPSRITRVLPASPLHTNEAHTMERITIQFWCSELQMWHIFLIEVNIDEWIP